MLTPFSKEDLGRVFDARALTRGRSLVLMGAVDAEVNDNAITARVTDRGVQRSATLMPVRRANQVVFDRRCSCGEPNCVHLAATALVALERCATPQQTEPKAAPAKSAAAHEKRLPLFVLAAGDAAHACIVSCLSVGDRTGAAEAITPRRMMMDPAAGKACRAVGRILGGGSESRVGVNKDALPDVLAALIESGRARWSDSDKRLTRGDMRAFDADTPPALPARSGILTGPDGLWYVDAGNGEVGRVQLRYPKQWQRTPMPKRSRGVKSTGILEPPNPYKIVDCPFTPVLRLGKFECPDGMGHLQTTDALTLDFDYGGVVVDGFDEQQFVRVEQPAGPAFIRRDRDAETAAFDALNNEGFVQMRVSDGKSVQGRRVLMFRDIDAGEMWHRFINVRVPALQSLGWRSLIDPEFGKRLIGISGDVDVQVKDAEAGQFSLELGVEVEGVRHPLLPILTRILAKGGMDAAHVVDGELIATLPDGRLVKLPADRIRPLLGIMTDLMEAADRLTEESITLPRGEAAAILELEDLLPARWKNAAAIEAYVERFRQDPEIGHVSLPEAFQGSLRPYQQHGVDWLQHLRDSGLNGLLADEMGLGKTAQTIAFLAIEEAAGRLDRPALVVVPTSLIANWASELTKFAPHFRMAILHGGDRHELRDQLEGVHVVVTTYNVLTRDIEHMRRVSWHVVVLDEAQAIKNPDARSTRAVCQLDARHRICLSGTPIENNLEELWSQFRFLMPGLFGDRRAFVKRFRTPIEKKGDQVKRLQLVRRIKPFILRRTKTEVAADLPPKYTIMRQITLAPAQREIYETIRSTLYDKIKVQLIDHSLAASRIVVLDALLKLRQACCDPRLVKLPSAQAVDASSKLDDLLDMLTEMIPEGRRILLFSQFTSMLDLIKPRLAEAKIPYVELRGDTRDRAEPVRSFQAEEVPLFLISLKAGGRGLNLTAADTVIHYDPWWNPAVEAQASDRAHRIGQTKPVFVYKLVAADTVEERIIELQHRKAELANIALSGEGELAGLSLDDVDYLFGAAPADA